MNILVAHTFYQQPGGEDIVFQQETELLRAAGHKVIEYRRSNDELTQLSPVRKALLPVDTIWSSRSHQDFGRLLDQHQPDVVHIHNTFVVMSPSVYSACKQRQIPVVQTLHNFRLLCPGGSFFRDGKVCEDCVEDGLSSAIRNRCYRGSRAATATVASMLWLHRTAGTWNEIDQFVVCSNFAREKFIESGLPAARINVKPNFISPDPGERTSAGDYALYAGRLSPEKGVRTLIAAWGRLTRNIPLKVVGDGPLKCELQNASLRHKLHHVEFVGRISREELLPMIRGARFTVFPSECYENFPMSIVESFACGVPVVATGLGSTKEIVANGVTGLAFPPGESSSLARAVEYAWNNPSIMSEMGHRARAEFESKYTASRNYQMLMNIYGKAIKQQPVIPTSTQIQFSDAA